MGMAGATGSSRDSADMAFVDGNELAGALGEIFAVDVTVARGRCAGCGRESAVAETVVYSRSPGLVARCPGCESVLLRVVRGRDRAWLDLRGVTCVEFSLPDTE
jgi:ribosomal protein S27E